MTTSTVESNQSLLNKFAKMAPYILREWRGLAIILVLTTLSASLTALTPWPMKIIVDYAVGDSGLPSGLITFFEDAGVVVSAALLVVTAGVSHLLLTGFGTLLDTASTWVWSLSGQRMIHSLAADLFAHLQRLSLSFHDRRSVGDSLSRLTGDNWCTYKITSELVIGPAQHIFTIITVTVVAWSLDPKLTSLMLAVTPVLAFSAAYFGKRIKRRSRQQREAQARMTSLVHQTLAAIPVVHAFTTEKVNLDKYNNISTSIVSRAQKGVLINHAYRFVNGLSMAVGVALIMYFGGQRILMDSLTVGSLLIFIAYIQTLKGSFGALMSGYGNLKATEASVDRVLEVLESDEALAESTDAIELEEPPAGEGLPVRMENVTFGYEAGRPVLNDFNLDVKPGEMVALVGATGAGKTTVASLVSRFFDPWSGRVMIGGVDIRRLSLASLRNQIALVLQEPFLLPISVSENIAYGRPDAKMEEIESAAVAANADCFVRELPDGYETKITERATNLSGGQGQRLSIARAFLKGSPILILDEPTSALDVESERLLLESIERLMIGRTTFVIAHRLSTIRHANKIVVLDNGRISEIGTHDELIKKKGRYYQFVELQSPNQTAGIST